MAYATTATDVQARLPGFTLSTTTKPSSTQATQWLVEADAFINVALAAAGLTSPATAANLLELFKSAATDYAEGHVRMALAAAGGDGGNDDGKDLIAGFKALVADIRANPAAYSAVDESSRVRFPSTTDDDGNTIEPIFQRDESVDDIGSSF